MSDTHHPQAVLDLAVEMMSAMDREFHDSPDRVIAIVGAAYLDGLMEQLLQAAFIEHKEAKALLKPEHALGESGNRIQLAFALGLITLDQRSDLKLIGRIRNQFAHSYAALAFDDEPIRGMCMSLQQPLIHAKMATQLFDASTAEQMKQKLLEDCREPREMYRATVANLFGGLLRRIRYIRRSSKQTWYSYDPDSARGPGAPAANA